MSEQSSWFHLVACLKLVAFSLSSPPLLLLMCTTLALVARLDTAEAGPHLAFIFNLYLLAEAFLLLLILISIAEKPD